MKKYILPALMCAAVFFSCSSHNVGVASVEDSAASEESEFQMPETDESSGNASGTDDEELTWLDNYVISQENEPKLQLKLTDEGLEVYSEDGNELLQTIEGSFKSDIEKAAEPLDFVMPWVMRIQQKDFDFDGYTDLFFPKRLLTVNIPGVYYRYDPDTGLYTEWDELNELGLLVNIIDNDNTLRLDASGSAVDHNSTTYKWENGKLKPISRKLQYMKGPDIIIDSFEYDEDGTEILVKREKALLDKKKNWLGTKEIPISEHYSFSANGSSITVKYENEFIQTLECDFAPDKNTLISDDFDFDGYNDLFALMDHGALYAPGTYFRFNPDTRLFEKWDEMNKIGRQMTVNKNEMTLHWCKRGGEKYYFEKFIYHWDEENLRLSEHRAEHFDNNNNSYITEVYSVDENGNEILTDSIVNDGYPEF